jgi:hypothetical protein
VFGVARTLVLRVVSDYDHFATDENAGSGKNQRTGADP